MKKKITSIVLLSAMLAAICTGCAPKHGLPPPPPAPPGAPAPPAR